MRRVDGGALGDWLGSTLRASGSSVADRLAVGKKCVGLPLSVCRGMAHIHSRGVAHFDLKPGNVLVTRDGVAKVADFGLAVKFDLDIDARRALVRTRYRGTPGFVAPELPKDGAAHIVTPMADVWSFGVMVGKVMGLFGREAVGGLKPALDCEFLVSRCTDSRPAIRPTFEELVVELEVAVEGLSTAV